MSLTAALSTALSGLNTAQRGLALTANNIANAQTPGYTRKVLPQENRVVDGQGRGTRALDTERTVDDFLTHELRSQAGRLARGEVLEDVYDQIQAAVLGEPGDSSRGIDALTRRLSLSLQELSNAPESTAARLTAVGTVDDTMAGLTDIETDIQLFRGDIDREIATTVGQVNTKLRALETINRDLTRNGSPADLLDSRDRLIQELAALVQIDVEFEGTGAARIYVAGGEQLLAQHASLMTYDRAATVVADTVFGPIRVFAPGAFDPSTQTPNGGAVGHVLVSGGVRRELTAELVGDAIPDSQQRIGSPLTEGKLEGLLLARDKVLPELDDQIGELTTRLRFALNAAHNASVPVPPPSTLLGTRTDLGGFGSAPRSGSAYLSVIDTSGDTVSTIEIDLSVASAADLATQLNSDLGALGTAVIDGTGRLSIDLADSSQGLAIASGSGSIEIDVDGIPRELSFSHYFGLNDLVVDGTDNDGPAVRSDILNDVRLLSTARLEIDSGPPAEGRLGGSGDNRGALDLASSMTEKTGFAGRGGLPAADFTVGGYVGEMTGLLAARGNQAKQATSIDRAIAEDLDYRKAAQSGVNIDEELAKLLQYQQSYTTAARVMSITNELFEELLNMAR